MTVSDLVEPVLHRGAISAWPPLELLDFSTLRSRFGDRSVRVHCAPLGSSLSKQFDRPFGERVRQEATDSPADGMMTVTDMPLREAVDCVLGRFGHRRPAIYAVAATDLIELLSPLAEPLILPEIVGSLGPVRPYLWLGPAGKSVPLHHDGVSGMLGQVLGRKRFRILAPDDPGAEPGDVNKFLSKHPDVGNVDRTEFPNFHPGRLMTKVVGPGDVLAVPRGWWHQVDYLDPCVSVNFWPPGYLGS